MAKVLLASPAIGSRSSRNPATGERASFHEMTKKAMYSSPQTYRQEFRLEQSIYKPAEQVLKYKCRVCGYFFEQPFTELDHNVSWETLVSTSFSHYSDDPSVYPVNNRAKEIMIYNDLGNINITCAPHNNAMKGNLTISQAKTSVGFLTDTGRFDTTRHDVHAGTYAPPVAIPFINPQPPVSSPSGAVTAPMLPSFLPPMGGLPGPRELFPHLFPSPHGGHGPDET